MYKLLCDLNLLKTLWINFKVFGFNRYFFRLPILVYKYTEIDIKRHSIHFICQPTFGLIRIGRYRDALYQKKHDYTKFSVKSGGTIIFGGRAHLLSGSRIIVQDKAELRIGKDFDIGSQSSIIATQSISIGDNVMISWDSLIMDSDLHPIYDRNGKIINGHRNVVIGKNVWIGCRSCILKGAAIPDGCIISATALITKNYDINDCIITSDGVIKKDISWKRLYK